MMEPGPAMFCRACDYPLSGASGKCPECGRGFDAADARTWSKRPDARRRRWGRRAVRVGIVLALVVALAEVFGPSRVARLTWSWPNGDGKTATSETRWCLVAPNWMGSGVRYPRWSAGRTTKNIETRGLVYCEFEFWSVGWCSWERGVRGATSVPGKIRPDGTVVSNGPVPLARPGYTVYFDVRPDRLGALCDEMLVTSNNDAPTMHFLPARPVPQQ